MTTILALDISSTHIGWCYLHPARTPIARSIALGASKVDIADRCLTASREVGLLIAACGDIDLVAIEDFVWMSAQSTIPQACVRGAVLAELRGHGLAYCVVAPATAKKALAGRGDACKSDMLRSAAAYFGHDPLFLTIELRRGTWGAWQGDTCVFDEHAADALGVGLSAVGRVVVEEPI